VTPLRVAVRQHLVEASTDVPLSWLFAALAGLSRGVDIERLAGARAAADLLGLRGAARRAFCRRAWWGAKASDVILARLRRRPADVLAWLAGTELPLVEQTLGQGRGVLLAAIHHGPEMVAATLVRDRWPDTLFVLQEPWRTYGRANVLVVGDAATRAAALVSARRHLRAGGVVFISPDGTAGAMSIPVPFRGGHVPMAAGATVLARLAAAPAVPVAALWNEGRLQLRVGAPIEPAPAPAAAWDVAWLGQYLEELDRWWRIPENLRLHGNVYERWRPD
jgi:hypothetical protein